MVIALAVQPGWQEATASGNSMATAGGQAVAACSIMAGCRVVCVVCVSVVGARKARANFVVSRAAIYYPMLLM